MLLENAILETLAYSDLFDYPLTLDELHRYLVDRADRDAVSRELASMKGISTYDGYYFLSSRDEIVRIRRARTTASQGIYARAMGYGRMLGALPFVRMVALTGSLAVMNASAGADMDFMLVTRPGRLWTARAMAVSLGRLMRISGHRICVNLLVSEDALAWPEHDLYSAREICQMVPVTGLDVYERFREANAWTEGLLPNCMVSTSGYVVGNGNAAIQRSLEFPLNGSAGDRLEAWAKKYQTQLIAERYGEGDETIFTADVCQANFHNHRQRTAEIFEARLAALGHPKYAGELAEVSS